MPADAPTLRATGGAAVSRPSAPGVVAQHRDEQRRAREPHAESRERVAERDRPAAASGSAAPMPPPQRAPPRRRSAAAASNPSRAASIEPAVQASDARDERHRGPEHRPADARLQVERQERLHAEERAPVGERDRAGRPSPRRPRDDRQARPPLADHERDGRRDREPGPRQQCEHGQPEQRRAEQRERRVVDAGGRRPRSPR